MVLHNFDEMVALAPKRKNPLRVVLAGADNENLLKGLFLAQEHGFAQPVLVGDRARIITLLDQLELSKKPYTLVEVAPGHDVTQAAIEVINCGDGDILMRGNIQARDFLMPVLDKNSGLRGEEMMSHVTLASLPDYPRLLALSDMAVVLNPDLNKKKSIVRNMTDLFRALGYEEPVLGLLTLVEHVTFHQLDTVEAQRLCIEQERHHFADCRLWGPVSYDLVISKESARLKGYDCPYTGEGFDGIVAPNINTAITLLKSWMFHAHAITCGAVMGAKVPIAFTSRSVAPYDAFLSVVLCNILAGK